MRLNLGADFNKEIKASIIQKKFPRMNKDDIDAMIETMKSQEDMMGKGESGRLMDKIPSLFNRFANNNANSGGK